MRVEPGQTALEVIPVPARSAARPRTSPTTACLDARVGGQLRRPSRPAAEATATSRPWRGSGASSSTGTAAATSVRTPSTLTSKSASHCVSGVSQSGWPPAMTPAAATTASRPPKRPTASHRVVHVGRAPHVAHDRVHGVSVARRDRVEVGDRRHRVAEGRIVGAAVDGDHVPSRRDQCVDAGGADAPGGAGDQGDGTHRSGQCALAAATRSAPRTRRAPAPPRRSHRWGRRARRWTIAGAPLRRETRRQLDERFASTTLGGRELHGGGWSASMSDVSVRPAWASPPAGATRQHHHVVALRRAAPDAAERASALPPWAETNTTPPNEQPGPSGPARRAPRLSTSVPIDSVPAKPACSPLAP